MVKNIKSNFTEMVFMMKKTLNKSFGQINSSHITIINHIKIRCCYIFHAKSVTKLRYIITVI